MSTPTRGPAIGLWTAVALVVGHTIGVGIFLTPAELIGALRSPALTLGLWVSCGLVVLAGALTFGELASRHPQAGGPYVYLREGWGERIAFLYGWQSLLIMDPGVTAALGAGLAQYLIVLWPGALGFERWIAIATIWVLALVNIAGLKLSARVLDAMTAFKLLSLAAIVIFAFAIGDGRFSHFVPFVARKAGAPPIGEALALGLIGVFYSFAGFWEASRLAGDVRDPRRTLPLGLTLGVVCLTIVYVATTVAFMYLVPAEQVTSASEFARRAGEAVLGPLGPRVFASIVVLSVVTSTMALLMMAPNVYVAMSRDGLFPASLAVVDTRRQSPARATALLAVFSTAFLLLGSFDQIVAFFMCTALGFIALAAAALFVMRRRDPGAGAFRTPGYPWSAALFVGLLVVVVTMVATSRPLQALAGLALVLVGVPVHHLTRARGPAQAGHYDSPSSQS
jgi:APA family basic amino acid/polyamine antiporter